MPKLTWPKRPVEARKTQVRFLGVPRRDDAKATRYFVERRGRSPEVAGSNPAGPTAAQGKTKRSVAQIPT